MKMPRWFGGENPRVHSGRKLAGWLSRLAAMPALLWLGIGCSTSTDPTRLSLAAADQLASSRQPSEDLKPYYQRLYMEGEFSATLNRMRLASAAIQFGAWKEAETALDETLRDIETMGPADVRSREALSHFKPEDIKRFKGEAHERAMAYWLRGLLYMRTQDWSNARACFKSVQIQDAAKKDPALRGNWASADWLEGWCNRNMGEGSAAAECWERAAQHALEGKSSVPTPTGNDNAVCVALLGFGPVKIPEGAYGERLTYRKPDFRSVQAQVNQRGTIRAVPVSEDLFAQASGRGLRRMDMVNADKAETRAATEAAGDALMTAGIGTTIGGVVVGDTTVAAAGLGTAAAGMAAKGIASSLQPKADTRTWDLLPATIHILPLALSAGDRYLEFQILDQQGHTVAEHKVNVDFSSQPQLILIMER
ncbi:MAG: hypothetical protein HY360_25640 [Verrucomicrobia bacterium]|nr:hypothetical protein [Verrucomicrobiota bacterium]